MKVTITIELENDAFRPRMGRELSRILREYASRIEERPRNSGVQCFKNYCATEGYDALKDLNGNTVGRATYSEE